MTIALLKNIGLGKLRLQNIIVILFQIDKVNYGKRSKIEVQKDENCNKASSDVKGGKGS